MQLRQEILGSLNNNKEYLGAADGETEILHEVLATTLLASVCGDHLARFSQA
jgi:hypothetical protein